MQQSLRGEVLVEEDELDKPKFDLRMRHRTETGFRTDDRKSSPLKEDPKEDKPRKGTDRLQLKGRPLPATPENEKRASVGSVVSSAFTTLDL
ncbi:hypothetical protein TNIN_129271 [Trichonephila inaurata madagascariensis]|uniref:Uncharacterized protein n=1 Tax=Trichonephila inaurata madagascariensis TaxID=2747483 RepID=A0A8X6Y1U9_9ARAC|nr:hypothetical protein TNIN_129271 [Trichonephila inaurata madagascariensis]